MNIAMMGGSFNPVHNGHIMLAETVRDRLGYEKILFVPAFHSPFKELPDAVSTADRIEMLRLAVCGHSGFDIELCEIDRGGVSFTIDTVAFLEKKYGSRIALIIGDDLAAGFPRWKHAAELAERTDIIVGRRLSSREKIPFPYRHTELENAVLPVSSSAIRNLIAADGGSGTQWKTLVPAAVCRYISERKLYGAKH